MYHEQLHQNLDIDGKRSRTFSAVSKRMAARLFDLMAALLFIGKQGVSEAAYTTWCYLELLF
jgi:hypothetical protein